MELAIMGKLICAVNMNGEDVLRNITTVAGTAASLVKATPGVGKPFWFFPTIPAGNVAGADFTNAPVATNNTASNQTLINAITANPVDVLTYDPPL